MTLSTADLAALSRLLDEALDLPEAERDGWLAELPPEHAPLLPRLREMMAAGRSAFAGFSELPALDTQTIGDMVAPGEPVGPYRALREIGRGGMGSVWLAERADGTLQRRIALKLPRIAWGGGLVKRMAREREIGARLEHQNIARLYDAGVDQRGWPYLAFEYVEGVPIDQWCREQQLSVRQRVQLVVAVARAVAYAHGRLVVHRDLKPSNVLISADGAVHLLDFGIAKLIQESGGDDDELTRTQGRVLTLHCASPEQVRGEIVTVASDVYSLGVLAYELLADARPFQPKRDTAGALEEAILRGDAPPASSRAPAIRAIALKGDLDAILTKAMRPEASDRYASADALADDLERTLRNEAVTARPDSRSYRAGKTLRRHWVGVSTGVVVVASIVGGAGAAAVQSQKAANAAERERLVQEFVADVFRVDAKEPSAPGQLRSAPAEAFLENSARLVKARFESQPAMQAQLYGVVSKAFRDMGANVLAREYAVQRVQALDAAQAGRREQAQATLELARLQQRLEDKDKTARRAIELADGHEPIILESQVLVAGVLHNQGKVDQAAQLLDQIDARVAALPHGGGVTAARALRVRANGLYRRNRHDEARRLWDAAIAKAIEAEGMDSETAAEASLDVAWQLAATGDVESTDRYFDAYAQTMRRLGQGHRISLAFWSAMAARYRAVLGNYPFERAHAVIAAAREDIIASGRPVTSEMSMEFDFLEGSVLSTWGKVEAAAPLLERTVPALAAATDSPARRFHYAVGYSTLLMDLGRHGEAEPWLAKAFQSRVESGLDKHAWMAGSYWLIAHNLRMSGRLEAAKAYLATAPVFPPLTNHEDHHLDRHNLRPRLLISEITLEQGEADGALRAFPHALLVPPDRARTSLDDTEARFAWGRILCAGNKAREGLAELEEVLSREAPKTYEHDPKLAYKRGIAGLCALRAGDRQRAKVLALDVSESIATQPAVSDFYKAPWRDLRSKLGLQTQLLKN